MNPIAAASEFLTARFGPLGPVMAIALLGVLLVLIALPTVMKRQRDRFRELKDLRPNATGDEKKRALRRTDTRLDKLERFAQYLEPKKEADLSAARLKLLRAGYPSKGSVRMYHAMQFLLAVSFLMIGGVLILIKSTNTEVTLNTVLMYTLLPCGFGYFIPYYWIEKRIDKRRTEIIEGFPDALDMMLVCVEAGQSLDQSIIRVAKESRVGYPALADEFDMVAHEVKAGKDRTTVLKDMTQRVDVQDVTSFVTTLIQSATFGTSIAEALRIYSADMRDKRVMRAEEKANKLPTKLTLGTMLFTVPPLLLILIGPSIHGIAVNLGKMAGG